MKRPVITWFAVKQDYQFPPEFNPEDAMTQKETLNQSIVNFYETTNKKRPDILTAKFLFVLCLGVKSF